MELLRGRVIVVVFLSTSKKCLDDGTSTYVLDIGGNSSITGVCFRRTFTGPEQRDNRLIYFFFNNIKLDSDKSVYKRLRDAERTYFKRGSRLAPECSKNSPSGRDPSEKKNTREL